MRFVKYGFLLFAVGAAALFASLYYKYSAGGYVYLPLVFTADREQVVSDIYMHIKSKNYNFSLKEFADYSDKDSAGVFFNKWIEAIASGDSSFLKEAISNNPDSSNRDKGLGYIDAIIQAWGELGNIKLVNRFDFGANHIYVLNADHRGSKLNVLVRFRLEPNKKYTYITGTEDTAVINMLEYWAKAVVVFPEKYKPLEFASWLKKFIGLNYAFTPDDVINGVEVNFVFSGIGKEDNDFAKHPAIVFYTKVHKYYKDKSYAEFIKSHTPRSADKMREAIDQLKHMSQAEREYYEKLVLAQEPVFVINANPAYIVYSYNPNNKAENRVLYILKGTDGQLKITNQARVSLIDTLYKNSKIINAAIEDVPFSSLRI